MRLAGRVAALEAANDPGFKPWHRIIVDETQGETEASAIAAYERQHGPLGDDPHFIIRFIV